MNEPVFGKNSSDVQESAIVVETEAHVARVRMNSHAGCDSCGASAVCHPASGNRPLVEVVNDIGARVGDQVELETDAFSKIIASLLTFGLPVFLLVLGAIWGDQLSADGSDSMVAGALVGLAVSFLVLRWFNHHFKNRVHFKPRATRILP